MRERANVNRTLGPDAHANRRRSKRAGASDSSRHRRSRCKRTASRNNRRIRRDNRRLRRRLRIRDLIRVLLLGSRHREIHRRGNRRRLHGSPVCTENLSSGVVVVKSAKDGV
jgi:hypothetical protein